MKASRKAATYLPTARHDDNRPIESAQIYGNRVRGMTALLVACVSVRTQNGEIDDGYKRSRAFGACSTDLKTGVRGRGHRIFVTAYLQHDTLPRQTDSTMAAPKTSDFL